MEDLGLSGNARAICCDLSRYPVWLVLFMRLVTPIRHVTALPAVEVLRNVVVTSWADTPIVVFRFHVSSLLRTGVS
jgi:hypothetical protein